MYFQSPIPFLLVLVIIFFDHYIYIETWKGYVTRLQLRQVWVPLGKPSLTDILGADEPPPTWKKTVKRTMTIVVVTNISLRGKCFWESKIAKEKDTAPRIPP